MRIVLATETYHPSGSGAVVFTDALAKGLRDAGHIVSIFAPSVKGGFTLEEHHGIPVYRFPSVVNPWGRGDSRLGLPSPIQMRAAMDAIRPDIVHLQSPFGIPVATSRLARKMGVPVVATHHFSYDFIFAYFKPLSFLTSITSSALTAYLQSVYEKCDAVTCPTESIARDLRDAGLEIEMKVVSNGINLKRYSPEPREDDLRAEMLPNVGKLPLILSVGRIDEDKRSDLLLESFEKMLKLGAKAHLAFAGNGDQVKALKEHVEAAGLQNDVTFLGRIKHESTLQPKLFRMADIFAITSPIDTQSLATLEAVASGLPVVAVKAGALPELARNNENGITVPFGNTNAFAKALAELVTDTKKRQAMAAKSRAIAEPHEFGKTIEKFIDLYTGLAQSR